jgi:hypothetical protein
MPCLPLQKSLFLAKPEGGKNEKTFALSVAVCDALSRSAHEDFGLSIDNAGKQNRIRGPSMPCLPLQKSLILAKPEGGKNENTFTFSVAVCDA